MKKLLVILTFLLASLFVQAQVHLRVNVNLNSQPTWGPVGYSHAEYYYLPDIDAYYYVPTRQFIWLENGRWVFAYNLPDRCYGYDLYSGYKVVINSPRPYLQDDYYRTRYYNYRGYHDQRVIGDRRRDWDRDRDRHSDWREERRDNRHRH